MWHKPSETPDVSVGDRVVIVVMKTMPHSTSKKFYPSLVILVAEEGHWSSPDPVYSGYGFEDGVAWAYESDLCAMAQNEVLG